MGKVVGLIGSASGKVGNVVYAVTNGIQTARVYQPNVANPKSKGQTDQRLKMVLAGRLSKIVPGEALLGFLGNNRDRRGKFVSNVAKSAVITTAGGVDTATVALGNILFSEGNLDLHSVSQDVTVSRNPTNPNLITISVAQSVLGVDTPAGYGEDVIVLLVDTKTSEFDYARIKTRDFSAGTTMEVRVSDITREYNVAVYIVPRAVDATKASMNNSYLGGDQNGILVSNDMDMRLSSYYGRSQLVGQSTVAPVS